jgi:hypothetical protein
MAHVAVAVPAGADPVVGSNLHVGESLGKEASGRLGSTIYLLQPASGAWSLGGELSGSVEAYLGGWGCGTSMSTGDDVAVPAVAVACVQPSVAAHALVSVEARPSARSLLRLVGGLGATSLWLLPGDGGHNQRDTIPSGLIRVGYLFELGEAMSARWSLGASLEERATLTDARVARSIGLQFEAVSR